MFFNRAKAKNTAIHQTTLGAFLRFLKSYPQQTENFLDSLSHLAKIFNLSAASIYLYERKTHLFLLKKWVGQKPMRFSIAAGYEFIEYLKIKGVSISRVEFERKSAHEIREAALFYYQQTLSSLVCPLIHDGQWLGIINVLAPNSVKEAVGDLVSHLELYADTVVRWLLYQELLTDNRKLSEITHVKNELLANVTHELKTPLNGIFGVCEALLDDTQLSTDTKLSLLLIKKSADDLNCTVNNLLELVNIEAGKNQRQREKTKILSLAQEVAAIYQDSCAKKGITLSVVSQAENSIFVFVHADQIRTVLMNLIGNAVKFTQAGAIDVNIAKNGEMVRVVVSDTGIGINEDKLHLIFEEFYQVSGSHTRIYGGTGLGLAIVKKIVTLHGGRVWVDSQHGAGAKFYFTLPLYPV